jgi:hypothetical protein
MTASEALVIGGGIDLASRADGYPIPNMVMWSGTGKRLGQVANGIRLADGTVSVCIKRGALQQVLREETLARSTTHVEIRSPASTVPREHS